MFQESSRNKRSLVGASKLPRRERSRRRGFVFFEGVVSPVSAAPLQTGAGPICQATGKASKLSGGKGESKKPFKARCSAVLKKLGGEKKIRDQSGCPVLVN
jgi:hypothetical protein